ncbi:MAG TPA: hypothetical protein VFO19_10895, partial [Vicinamibacterales bacterium]|nr:hypothetical protein [Vicinamibacterales bacterium]
MIFDRQSGSTRRRRRAAITSLRATSGEPLTLLLIGVSILVGIALAIACSYRPVALWWLMIAGSAVSIVRLGAELTRKSRANRTELPALAAALIRSLARLFDAVARRGSGPSKASLDRQHTRFLVWFTEHNLLWTMLGFGVSLVIWHRFGPTVPALVVMAALMSCALFAALGATVGSSAPTLGLCWREPCRTPDLRSLRRLVHDIGCVIVLTHRRDYAARRDWANGGRFHELFLTVDDLARAGVEPGLQAVLTADDPAALRRLARKERLDRALALTPVFAAAVIAALIVVPPLAGSEPLPSLWAIVSGKANAQARASASSDDDSRDLPPGSTATPSTANRMAQDRASDRSREMPSSQSGRDAASGAARAGAERPDQTGRQGERATGGDPIAAAEGDGAAAAGEGAAVPGGDGAGAGPGTPGPAGASPSRDDGSDGTGGRGSGGDPRRYGTRGVAPQRAESPAALGNAPVNPGKAIEIDLPAFA